ncbi:MAG: polymerase beta subunit, N-terminal domain, partial [Pseudomonadota bacterium]
MKKTGFTFHGDGKEIAGSLKYLVAAVDRSAALPILSCVALEVMPDGRLTARATDLDVASQVTLPVTMEQG